MAQVLTPPPASSVSMEGGGGVTSSQCQREAHAGVGGVGVCVGGVVEPESSR